MIELDKFWSLFGKKGADPMQEADRIIRLLGDKPPSGSPDPQEQPKQ